MNAELASLPMQCRFWSQTDIKLSWNQEREKAGLDQDMSEDTTAAVQVGVEALKLLIQADREKAAAQK